MRFWPLFVLVLSLALSVPAQGAEEAHSYESGYKAIMRLGSDLYKALKPKERDQIHVQPVSLETDVTPFVRCVEYPDDTKPLKMVFISIGFVDLMNNVAHAKAIDGTEKGYFEKYILSLAQEKGENSLKDLPGTSDKKYWTEDMINEQLSNFNQMVGMILAIELSHHYLGHYKKYADKLSEEKGKPQPINSLLTEKEWEESVKAGARNALECGLGAEGLKSLFDSIEKMPTRPDWTIYFLPKNIKIAKIKKELDKMESDYFKGK
jgi:hypothetical protein